MIYVIQGDYGFGHGWEDLSAYETREEARAGLKAYQEAEPGVPHRIIRKREDGDA